MPRNKILVKQRLAISLGMPFDSPTKVVALKIVEESQGKILIDESILADKRLCLAFLSSISLKRSYATR